MTTVQESMARITQSMAQIEDRKKFIAGIRYCGLTREQFMALAETDPKRFAWTAETVIDALAHRLWKEMNP